MIAKKILIGMFVLFLGFAAHASQNIDQMYQDELWKQMEGQTNLAFKRVTSGGELAGCELTFKYAYRDFRTKGGRPLLVIGALANYYTKGKLFGYLLKVQPIQLSWNNATNSGVRTVLNPAQATMAINGINVTKFARSSTKCETGGICVAIVSKTWDEDSKLLEITSKQPVFDADIFWSLTKSGIDESFKLSSLKVETGSNLQVRQNFTQCLLEVMQKQMDYMNAKGAK